MCAFFFQSCAEKFMPFLFCALPIFWVVELRGHLSLKGAVCFVEGLRRYHPLITMLYMYVCSAQ